MAKKVVKTAAFIQFEFPYLFPLKRSRFSSKPYPHEYDPKYNIRRKKEIAELYRAACGVCNRPEKIPRPNEVFVYVTLYSPLPKGKPKRIESEPFTVKPDGDNCLKGICDALNGVAWDDDAQVTIKQVIKARRTRKTIEKTAVEIHSPYWWA